MTIGEVVTSENGEARHGTRSILAGGGTFYRCPAVGIISPALLGALRRLPISDERSEISGFVGLGQHRTSLCRAANHDSEPRFECRSEQ